MSDKRIIEYETATALADDDYILLDSETGGTCKIKAKKLQPPLPNRITATYTQTITVKDNDSLDVLRPDLVVKAYYDGGIVETVTNYTLSGTLEVGTSTITATYKGKTDTFDVTVTQSMVLLYNWDYTQSLYDSVANKRTTLSAGATRDSNGLHIEGTGNYASFSINKFDSDRYVEIDFGTCSKKAGNCKIFRAREAGGTTSKSWYLRMTTANEFTVFKGNDLQNCTFTTTDANVFNNKTMRIHFSLTDTILKIYADNDLVYEGEGQLGTLTTLNAFSLGDYDSNYSYYDMTIKAVRIYANQ